MAILRNTVDFMQISFKQTMKLHIFLKKGNYEASNISGDFPSQTPLENPSSAPAMSTLVSILFFLGACSTF